MEDYSLVKQIGKGSYGKVWLIRKNNSNKQYVLKQIDMQNASRQEQCSAITEVKLLSTLKHPNIVTYYSSFQKLDGILNIIMGYCENGDLYTYIRSRKGLLFPEKQVVEWFIQICMALQYLHERNILHRDLKTQNIFLTKTKIIKIGDLGIARVLEGTSDLATTLIGTPYYMSPELFANQPYNHKSDVWALGCCVYEMTTLKHAFNARDLNSLMYRVLLGKLPNMPKQYSEELVDLMRSMLSYDASSRPSVKCILQNDYVRRHIMDFLQETNNRCRKSSGSDEKYFAPMQYLAVHKSSKVANKKEHSELKRINEGIETPIKETPKDSESSNIFNLPSCRTKNATVHKNFQELKSRNCLDKGVAVSVQNTNKLMEFPQNFSKNFNANYSNLSERNNVCDNTESSSQRTDSSIHAKNVVAENQHVNSPRRRRQKWQKALSEDNVVSEHNEHIVKYIRASSLPSSSSSSSSQLVAHPSESVNAAACNGEHTTDIHKPNFQQNKCIVTFMEQPSSTDCCIVYKNSEARRRRREKLLKQQLSAKQTDSLSQEAHKNSANEVIADHCCADPQAENAEEKIDAEFQEFIGILNSTLRMNDNGKQHPVFGKEDTECETISRINKLGSENRECLIQRRDTLIKDCSLALGDELLRKVLDAIDYTICEADLQSRLLNMLGKEQLDAYGGKIIQLKIYKDAIAAT